MQDLEYEYESMILDDEEEYVAIDYSKVIPFAPDITYDYGDDLRVAVIEQLETKVKGLSFTASKENEYCETQLYMGDEDLTQFQRNNLKEIDLPFTVLEKQIDSVLTQKDKSKVESVFCGLQHEWIVNGARSVLTNWPELKINGTEFDNDKVHLLHTYKMQGLKTNNKYLYEMYAYLLHLEEAVGFRLIWSKHWRAMKILLAFADYDYRLNYNKLLRLCDDRFFSTVY